MRVTNNMLTNNLLKNLVKSNSKMALIQNQLSSGQSITKPSDNPVGIETALRLKSTISSIGQWKSNASEALAYMESTEDYLGNMTSMLHRIRAVTVQGADGSNSPNDREQIAKEIDQLALQFRVMANSQVSGKYIFSGTFIDKAPLDPYTDTRNVVESTFNAGGTGVDSNSVRTTGTGLEIGSGYTINVIKNATDAVFQLQKNGVDIGGPVTVLSTDTSVTIGDAGSDKGLEIDFDFATLASGTVEFEITDSPPAVPASWNGNSTVMQFEVGPNLTIPISISGIDLFEIDGTGKSKLFETLNQLSQALYNDDTDGINAGLEKLDGHMDNFLKLRSELGARTNRMNVIKDQLENSINITKTNLSSIQDVDMAEKIMEFKSVENIFKAALSVGAQIIQPSLVDFMN